MRRVEFDQVERLAPLDMDNLDPADMRRPLADRRILRGVQVLEDLSRAAGKPFNPRSATVFCPLHSATKSDL